jgi:hypothetical protein
MKSRMMCSLTQQGARIAYGREKSQRLGKNKKASRIREDRKKSLKNGGIQSKKCDGL